MVLSMYLNINISNISLCSTAVRRSTQRYKYMILKLHCVEGPLARRRRLYRRTCCAEMRGRLRPLTVVRYKSAFTLRYVTYLNEAGNRAQTRV